MEYKFDKYRHEVLPNSDEIKEARKGRKTVAMVGMASTSRHYAPFDDKSIPIWALNESATPRFDFLKRVTRIYQLHPEWDFRRPYNHNFEDYPNWLKKRHPFEIIMQDVFPDIPSSKKYPFDEVMQMFGNEACYFTSSMPYLIAHALYEGYDRIELYGFEMAANEEYANQKPCGEFWLGIAIGRGCQVYLPPGCALLGKQMMLYGYEMTRGINPMHVEIRERAFTSGKAQLAGKMAEAQGKKKALIDEHKVYVNQFKMAIAQIDEKMKTASEAEKVDLSGKRAFLVSDNQKEYSEFSAKVVALDNEMGEIASRINAVTGSLLEVTNEKNSLQGHLGKWIDPVEDKDLPLIRRMETAPTESNPGIIMDPNEMQVKTVSEMKFKMPPQPPPIARRHRHKKKR